MISGKCVKNCLPNWENDRQPCDKYSNMIPPIIYGEIPNISAEA